MDSIQMPETENISPEFNAPEVNKSVTNDAFEPTRDLNFKKTGNEFDFLVPYVTENDLVVTSEASAVTNETMFSERHGYDNGFSKVNPHISYFSSLDASKGVDMPSESRDHSVTYDTQIVSEVHMQNRKENISICKMPTEKNQMENSTRSEISRKGIQVLTTDHQQSGTHSHGATENSATSRVTFDNDHFPESNHEFRNIQESLFQNQGMQITDNLDKNSILTSGQNIALNIGISEISQNNVPRESSDTVASKRESGFYEDDFLAVPGPSGFQRYDNSPNLYEETLHSGSKTQLTVVRNEKTFTCRFCKKKISVTHAVLNKKNVYKCCKCEYETYKQANLEMHSHEHLPKMTCNKCTKEHTEGDSHEREHICSVCNQSFQWQTQLKTHSLDHVEYFQTHCWVCRRKINAHLSTQTGKKIYVCCICRSKSYVKRAAFQNHINIHRPKIFCKFCRDEYSVEEKGSHNGVYTCKVCKEMFHCKTQLEDHTVATKHTFYELFGVCDVCEKKFDTHIRLYGENISYHCCKCSKQWGRSDRLLDHLYSYIGLRLFKCDKCGKRFIKKRRLQYNSECCSGTLYKCEDCGEGFPSIDHVYTHRLKEHWQI